ncbi:MAG: indolepyruvate oxidoreductase subunit beta family protein [Boseongicola sp.]
MSDAKATAPLRILLAALGGEGGGLLMNWIVGAARAAGHNCQATSVPGVAQRTGSTSYYIEIAMETGVHVPVFGLVPMPARVDVLVSSELVETARAMVAGYVSPNLTTTISSSARVLTTAEKIEMGDGRIDSKDVVQAVEAMSKKCVLLDLAKIAEQNHTYVSAAMFGALAGSEVLPWPVEASRNELSDPNSIAGFDAALQSVKELPELVDQLSQDQSLPASSLRPSTNTPSDIQDVIELGCARCIDFQDKAYGTMYLEETERLVSVTDLSDLQSCNALKEACRRLALWMSYEDVARVADLKTRTARFDRVQSDINLQPDQVLRLTEFLKPRAEEIADILPVPAGSWISERAERGKDIPFLGRGVRLRSNGVFGYWMLRFVASLKRIRRKSLRFAREQSAIDRWMRAMEVALPNSPGFAEGLAELPRVLKGYSDTLMRGRAAYDRITESIVDPAVKSGFNPNDAVLLRAAISAALADDSHTKLSQILDGGAAGRDLPPTLRAVGGKDRSDKTMNLGE